MTPVSGIEVVDRCTRVLEVLLSVQTDQCVPEPTAQGGMSVRVLRSGRMLTPREAKLWSKAVTAAERVLGRVQFVMARADGDGEVIGDGSGGGSVSDDAGGIEEESEGL